MELEKITEKIIEYLDGELPPSEERELFDALASNEELRHIMREHLTITRTIHTDLDAFQPPPEATMSILNSLGIGVTSTTQPFEKSFWAKTKKFGVPILLVLITSLITFLITYNIMKQTEHTEVAKSIVQTPPIIIASSVDNEVATKTKKSSHYPITIASKKFATKENTNKQESLNFSDNKNSSFALETKAISNNAYNESILTPRNSEINHLASNFTDFPKNRFFETEQPKNIYFTLRGMVGKSSPNPNISYSAANKIFSNASTGLYFTQWDNVKFGIEFGNEVFGLSYLNVKDGVEYTYEQKPNIYWGAVAVDYNFPFEILSIKHLHPFMTVLAGGSQIGGPLFKGIAGLKFRPYGSNFELYLGTEGTLLFYQNQKNYYLTRKLSITYGMSIIF